MASFVFILNSYHRKNPIKLKVQLIWERLSYWSLKAYMTMLKGIIALINCGSLLLNSAKKTALKWAFMLSPSFLLMHKQYYQYQTNTSHDINCNRCVCVSHLRNNLSPSSCILVIEQVQRSICKMAGYSIQSKTGLRSIKMLKKEPGQTSYLACLGSQS